jgi:tripartite-type tricarboxylate transporter receptor subunit TctC
VHVPYKGAVSVPDLIAGRVQILMSGVPQSLSHIQAGRLRALGVTTPKRSPVLPNVPTIAEAGVPGYAVTVWYGVFTTGRTPQPIVQKLNAGFVQAIQSADVKQQLGAMGLEAVGNPSAEFAASVKSEIRQWADVIRKAGIKAE